jgi:plasmid stabilization system protein ParE
VKVEIAPAALDEVAEAADWYESRQVGLGRTLVDAFEHGVQQIADHPLAWHPLGHTLRRYRLDRFPYGIIYHVLGETVRVVAFAHHSRRPRYWRSRLNER